MLSGFPNNAALRGCFLIGLNVFQIEGSFCAWNACAGVCEGFEEIETAQLSFLEGNE